MRPKGATKPTVAVAQFSITPSGCCLARNAGAPPSGSSSSGGRLKLPLVGARHVAHARPGTQTELNKARCKIEGGGASQVGRRRAKPLDAFRAIEPDRQVDAVVAAHGEQTNVGALLVERQTAAAVNDEAELCRQGPEFGSVRERSLQGRRPAGADPATRYCRCRRAGSRGHCGPLPVSAASSSRSCSASADHRAGKLSASTPRI